MEESHVVTAFTAALTAVLPADSTPDGAPPISVTATVEDTGHLPHRARTLTLTLTLTPSPSPTPTPTLNPTPTLPLTLPLPLTRHRG